MTMFKPGRFRALAGTLAVVTALTLGLSGCDQNSAQIANAVLRLQQAVQSEEKLKAEMQSMAASPNSEDWSLLLGEMLLYVPDDYSRQLTANRDTFMGAVLGTALNIYPELTYDGLDKTIGAAAYCGSICSQNGGNRNKKNINREEMDFYKLWSNVWMETVMKTEEAAEMKELYALFQKRIGSYGPFSFVDIRALLKDEAAFVQFINDDKYARDWMLARASQLSGPNIMGEVMGGASQYDRILQGIVPQITIPVLPNTAS